MGQKVNYLIWICVPRIIHHWFGQLTGLLLIESRDEDGKLLSYRWRTKKWFEDHGGNFY
jgi:hypothetical protein